MAKKQEVDMVDASTEDKPTETQPVEEAAPVKDAVDVLTANVAVINKAVRQKDVKAALSRVFRTTSAARKKWTRTDLQNFIRTILPDNHQSTSVLMDAIDKVCAPANAYLPTINPIHI